MKKDFYTVNILLDGLVMEHPRRRTKTLIITAVCCIFITCLFFYPGYLSPDSVEQLQQGRSDVFSNWHPPILSFLWGQIDKIIPGPTGMLIIQNILFWIGLALWVLFVFPKVRSGPSVLIILLVGFIPPIFFNLSTIWKDIQMASSLLFSSGCFLWGKHRESWLATILGVTSLFYAIAVRHNALIAALPLAYYAGYVISYKFYKEYKNAEVPKLSVVVGLGLGIIVLFSILTHLVTTHLTKGVERYPVQQILVHDLVAISLAEDNMLIPSYLMNDEQLTKEDLKILYSPDTVVYLYCCNGTSLRLNLVNSQDNIEEIFRIWINSVRVKPKAYLLHRLRVFMSEFGIFRDAVCYPIHYGIVDNDLNISYKENRFTHQLVIWVMTYQNSILFRGWFYLLLNLLGLVYLLIFYRRYPPGNKFPIMLLGTSGFTYSLSYFFISTTCDFRMYFWSVLTTIIFIIWIAYSIITGMRKSID